MSVFSLDYMVSYMDYSRTLPVIMHILTFVHIKYTFKFIPCFDLQEFSFILYKILDLKLRGC